jgi:hypothetical protein
MTALSYEIERSRKFIVLQNTYARWFKIGGSDFLPTAGTKQAHAAFNVGIFGCFLNNTDTGFVYGYIINQILTSPIIFYGYIFETAYDGFGGV